MLKHKNTTILRSEEGVTLIELLAAIAILSIVVTSFLAFFIQSANTNKQTNEVNEATFIAQGIMEEITFYSSQDFTAAATQAELESSQHGFTLTYDFTADTDSSLYQIIVTVSKGNKTHAKMETRLPFNQEESED